MGLKLEIILILLVTTIFLLAINVKVTNGHNAKNLQTKELEFTDITLTEVDTNKTMGVAYGTYGIRDQGILTIENFQYYDNDIKLLRAKKAIYDADKIYLDNDVVFVQKEGSRYYTDHAVYDQQNEILDVTSPFKAIMGKSVVRGDTLRYWIQSKKAYATNVDAIVYTKEK